MHSQRSLSRHFDVGQTLYGENPVHRRPMYICVRRSNECVNVAVSDRDIKDLTSSPLGRFNELGGGVLNELASRRDQVE